MDTLFKDSLAEFMSRFNQPSVLQKTNNNPNLNPRQADDIFPSHSHREASTATLAPCQRLPPLHPQPNNFNKPHILFEHKYKENGDLDHHDYGIPKVRAFLFVVPLV
jgi:hypothetical protein